MQSKRNPLLAGLLIAGLSVPGLATAKDGLRFTTGIDYSTGKYGGSVDTDITYVPFTFKYRSGDWAFKATLPYIRVTGPSNVLPDIGQVSTTGGARTTNSGVGDVILSASYTLTSNRKTGTIIDLTGKVKLPTADEKKGLGTGKTDYYVQVDIFKVGGQTTPFATLGYKVYGDTSTINFNNVLYASLGVSHRMDNTNSVGAILDLRERSTAAGAPRREFTLFMTHKLDSNRKLQFYAVKGFADGSPDWGLGATISLGF